MTLAVLVRRHGRLHHPVPVPLLTLVRRLVVFRLGGRHRLVPVRVGRGHVPHGTVIEAVVVHRLALHG